MIVLGHYTDRVTGSDESAFPLFSWQQIMNASVTTIEVEQQLAAFILGWVSV